MAEFPVTNGSVFFLSLLPTTIAILLDIIRLHLRIELDFLNKRRKRMRKDAKGLKNYKDKDKSLSEMLLTF